MLLYINGRQEELPDTIQTISDMLNHFQLTEKPVIVELNRAIIQKQHYPITTLSDRDAIEIVHFVGGG